MRKINLEEKQRTKKKSLKSLEQRMKDWEKAQLSILPYRTEFCERLENEHVLIVIMTDDSGKSTQLPQYAAEHFGSLVVGTQAYPTVAISLADQVAQEYDGTSVGVSVGYQVGDANQVVGSSIMFMTNATLISESQRDPALKYIRVLIIDEVDNSSSNTYDVLCIAKRLLAQRPKDFYVVILLSTTINPTGFLKFFERTTNALLEVKGCVAPVNSKGKEQNLTYFMSIQVAEASISPSR
jgi:HrpA-like RNA helicase